MGDNYSHYLISCNITNLSWVSYHTPAPSCEIRVSINFSTKLDHQKLIPNSDQDQDHMLELISQVDPISFTASACSSTTALGNIEEMIRKSMEEGLLLQGLPVPAGAQYCAREELTQLACNAVLTRLRKKQSILGVHLMDLDIEVAFRYCDVIGGCDGPRQTSCCICLEDLSHQPLEILPCWHAFHYHCLLTWRGTCPHHCPLCRKLRGLDFIISTHSEGHAPSLTADDR